MAHPQAEWRHTQATRGQIVASLLSEPNLSRSDLVERLGLGPATISTQVRRLLELGILTEGPSQVVGAGRPRVPLSVRGDTGRAIGVGMGVSSAAFTVINLDGTILDERRLELDTSDPEALSRSIGSVTHGIVETDPGAPWWGLGVAVSGVVAESTGMVSFSVVHNWEAVPLGNLVARQAGLPVRLANDIAALAYRELYRPRVETPSDFLLVSVGSGVGMALVRDHQVITGDQGASTEMGHVSVDPLGPACRCGNHGCLQALLGLDELLREAARVSPDVGDSVVDLVAAAVSNHRVARVVDRGGYWLGRAVGGACTMVGLSNVLLTGESLPLWPHMAAGFETGLHETVPTLTNPPNIERRAWDPAATAVGAATIVLNRVLGSG